jgi:hypothetical protein
MLEIGKIHKSRYVKMTYADLINEGAVIYAEGGLSDPEDIFILNYYRDVIKAVLAYNNSGHLFYKDATASGLQILGLILGCKNETVSKRLNLINDGCWYDTYTYIISSFVSKQSIPAGCEAFFTRKHLKKTIMLINYKGSYVNCLKSFIQSTGLNARNHLYVTATKYFREFYLYLLHVFDGEEFFKHPSYYLIKLIDNENDLLTEAEKANAAIIDERKRA